MDNREAAKKLEGELDYEVFTSAEKIIMITAFLDRFEARVRAEAFREAAIDSCPFCNLNARGLGCELELREYYQGQKWKHRHDDGSWRVCNSNELLEKARAAEAGQEAKT